MTLYSGREEIDTISLDNTNGKKGKKGKMKRYKKKRKKRRKIKRKSQSPLVPVHVHGDGAHLQLPMIRAVHDDRFPRVLRSRY
jgi:hypothetical protein